MAQFFLWLTILKGLNMVKLVEYGRVFEHGRTGRTWSNMVEQVEHGQTWSNMVEQVEQVEPLDQVELFFLVGSSNGFDHVRQGSIMFRLDQTSRLIV